MRLHPNGQRVYGVERHDSGAIRQSRLVGNEDRSRKTGVRMKPAPLGQTTKTMACPRDAKVALFGNGAASNPIAGIACGGGLHIVGLRMNHQRRTTFAKQ